ncbi:MAG: helix-turn-helix transcriptional regulator [Cellulomonadaceae bacterium]
MDTSIDPAERLLNLVIALVNTGDRMTKEQIRTSVAGYRGAASGDAFERMFERDKELLRELGVPVVTVDDSGYAEEIGYRIDADAYSLAPLELTSAEYAVLGLAAELWQDRTLRAEAGRALTKLRAVGDQIEDDASAVLAPSVRAAPAAYGPVLDALLARRAVTFTYRAASTGAVRRRSVEPWRLAVRGGGWYLLGLDRDRGAARVFGLGRIVGRVRATGPAGAVQVPAVVDVDALLGIAAEPQRQAVLAVLPERAPALRSRGEPVCAQQTRSVPAGRDLVAVPFADTDRFAAELAGCADAVVVLEPADLRAEVLRLLHAAAAVPAAREGEHHG